mmetsp:Transcript_50369/g.157313  ORF Transcript_50369/g.157313 Transcript_50369/m.157313 type:complete len:751 (-) Transcript_50369:105-2357(-)
MIPLGRLAFLFAILFSTVGRTTESGIQPMYLRGGGLFGKRVGGRYGGTVLPSAQIEEMKASEQAQTAAEPAGKAEEDKRGLTANDAVAEHERSEGDQQGSEKKVANESPSESSASIRSVGDAKNTSDVSPQKEFNMSSSNLFGSDLHENFKYIYIVSDSTGFTASHALTSVMAQFDSLAVDWNGQDNKAKEKSGGVPEVRTQMFSNVKDLGRLDRIVALAAKMSAFIVFTLVDPALHTRLLNQCRFFKVPHQDLLGPLVRHLSSFLEKEPTGLPRGSVGTKRKPLSDKYFKRVEAVEFTIKQDDGAQCRNLQKADVILLGVSRSSKTPLSMYLAQQFGYKVANVPLVLNIQPPSEIFEVDPRRVFGLIIQPQYLRRIRTRRLAGTGVDTETIGKSMGSFDYSNIKYIQEELKWARDLYAAHPEWSVVDVTGRAVEENAAIIAELMPGKPTPVEAALHALDCNFFILEPSKKSVEFPIVFASDGFLQATGYSREEIIGKSVFMLHGPNTEREVITKVREHLREGKEGHFEILNYRKDGSTFNKDVHLSPVRNFEGEVAFIFCTQVELEPLAPGFNPTRKPDGAAAQPTEEDGDFRRDRVDKEKTSEILRSVHHRGWISVSISDASVPGMPIVFASEGFFKMTGYEPAEILGHSLEKLYGADSDPTTVAMIREAMETHQAVSTCILNYRKDGRSFWNHLSLQPVSDSSGSLRYYVATQYTGTSGVGNLVRDCGATFPSGLQTHASITPFLPT